MNQVYAYLSSIPDHSPDAIYAQVNAALPQDVVSFVNTFDPQTSAKSQIEGFVEEFLGYVSPTGVHAHM